VQPGEYHANHDPSSQALEKQNQSKGRFQNVHHTKAFRIQAKCDTANTDQLKEIASYSRAETNLYQRNIWGDPAAYRQSVKG